MAKLPWLQNLSDDSAREIKGKHQFTELGIFGFYWWKVELRKDEFDSFSMAYWDEDREVWWGYAADGTVYWKGHKPPSTTQLLSDMQDKMTDKRAHPQATEIFDRICQEYGFEGVMAMFDLAKTPHTLVTMFNGEFEGSVDTFAARMNLE